MHNNARFTCSSLRRSIMTLETSKTAVATSFDRFLAKWPSPFGIEGHKAVPRMYITRRSFWVLLSSDSFLSSSAHAERLSAATLSCN